MKNLLTQNRMEDMSYQRAMMQLDPSYRDSYIEKLTKGLMQGRIKVGEQLFTLCFRDPYLYGDLLVRIKYKTMKERNDRLEQLAAESKVPTGPFTISETPASETDKTESKEVRANGGCGRQEDS